MLFFPFRDEECDLKIDGSYSNKLSDPLVLDIVNKNKIIFEPNSELIENALRTYREDFELNFDAYAQQENEHVVEEISNLTDIEQDELDEEILNNLPPASFKPTVISDDELNTRISSLNQRQREIFDVVLTWGKTFVQNLKLDEGSKIEPLHIFLTGNGGCGKSFLVKCMYEALNKLLSYKGDNSKAKVMLLAPTGVAAININGTTIHTGLGIPCTNFHQLSDRQRTNLRIKLENVSAIFIDESSMVSAKLLLQTHQRLCEIFGTSDSIPFAGKTVIVSGDLYQLPPVLAKPVFSMDGFIEKTLKLWHNIKLAELNETMRQQGDDEFIDLLNNVRTLLLCSLEGALKRLDAPCKVIFTLRKLKTCLPSLKPHVDVSLRSKVVYKIKCPCCNACYVGQTSRHLLCRVREHKRRSSPVGSHFVACNTELTMENVKIIASTLKSITYLMTLEALFINDIKPSLNTKDEYRSRALVIKF